MSGRRNDGDGTEAADPAGLLRALGVPMTAETLERALTHRSYAYENGGLPTNERLEFLGDSVLSLVVTDTLFKGHPTLPEGQLAKLRAAVVQMSTLAEVAARELDLGSFVRLGRGEEGTGGRHKPSILADTLEGLGRDRGSKRAQQDLGVLGLGSVPVVPSSAHLRSQGLHQAQDGLST